MSITPTSNHTLRVTLNPVGSEANAVPVTDGRVLEQDNWGDPILQIAGEDSEEIVDYSGKRIQVQFD